MLDGGDGERRLVADCCPVYCVVKAPLKSAEQATTFCYVKAPSFGHPSVRPKIHYLDEVELGSYFQGATFLSLTAPHHGTIMVVVAVVVVAA